MDMPNVPERLFSSALGPMQQRCEVKKKEGAAALPSAESGLTTTAGAKAVCDTGQSWATERDSKVSKAKQPACFDESPGPSLLQLQWDLR